MKSKKIIIEEEVKRLWTLDNVLSIMGSTFALVLSVLLYGIVLYEAEVDYIILPPFVSIILLISTFFLMITFLHYLCQIEKEKQTITREVKIIE